MIEGSPRGHRGVLDVGESTSVSLPEVSTCEVRRQKEPYPSSSVAIRGRVRPRSSFKKVDRWKPSNSPRGDKLRTLIELRDATLEKRELSYGVQRV